MVTTIGTGRTETIENRRNLALNPNGANTVGFLANSASYTATRGTAVPVGNPQGITTGVRGTSTIGGPGVMSLYNVDALGLVAPGRFIGAWFWTNRAGLVASFRSGDTVTPLTLSGWTWVTGFVPAGEYAGANVYRADGGALDAGAIAYITGVTVLTDAEPDEAIWGSRAAAGARTYAWAGVVNNSASIEWLTRPVQAVPQLVDGFQAAREIRNVVHPIANRSNPDITLRAPGLRSGEFRCLFATQAAALEAFALLAVPQVFTISDPDVPAIGMSFVAAEGDLRIELDDETRSVWWVVVPFQEVAS